MTVEGVYFDGKKSWILYKKKLKIGQRDWILIF